MKGKNYILSIGIDDYSSVSKLNNAVRDAKEFTNLLLGRYTFEESDVVEIYNNSATRAEIIETFRKLMERLNEEDSLIIYFSGHGDYDDMMNMGYWIPVDAKSGERHTYIENTTIINYIRAMKSKHTFLVADSCFSGALFSQNRRLYADVVADKKSRWALTSGRIELVSDGIIGDNSPFANCLLEFLKNNNESKLPISKLVNYVKITVGDNVEQTPQGNPLYGVGDEGGELVLELKNNNESIIIGAKHQITNFYYGEENKKQFEEELAFYKCAFREDFLRFEEEYPKSKYLDKVKRKIEEINREKNWRIKVEKFVFNLCKSQDDYEKYISLYPNGIFYEEAFNQVTKVDEKFIESSLNKIREGNLKDAIEDVVSALSKKDTNHYNEILVLASRFNSINKREMKGLMDHNSVQMEYNKITDSLIRMLDRIKNEN